MSCKDGHIHWPFGPFIFSPPFTLPSGSITTTSRLPGFKLWLHHIPLVSQDTLLNLPRPLIYKDPPLTGMRVLWVNVCKVLRTVPKGGCFTPICLWSCSAKFPRHIYQPQHARASKHLNLGNSDKGQVSYANGTSGNMFFSEATSSTLLIRSYMYYAFRKHHAYFTEPVA